MKQIFFLLLLVAAPPRRGRCMVLGRHTHKRCWIKRTMRGAYAKLYFAFIFFASSFNFMQMICVVLEAGTWAGASMRVSKAQCRLGFCHKIYEQNPKALMMEFGVLNMVPQRNMSRMIYSGAVVHWANVYEPFVI